MTDNEVIEELQYAVDTGSLRVSHEETLIKAIAALKCDVDPQQTACEWMTREEHILNLESIGCDGWTVTTEAKESLEWAISELKENKGEWTYYPPCIDCNKKMDEIRRAYDKLKALPSAENKGEWIPVSERLPEIHQYVLLSLRSLDVEVGFRAETEPYFYCHGADGCYIEPQNVLAWQPLPEPYKEGE